MNYEGLLREHISVGKHMFEVENEAMKALNEFYLIKDWIGPTESEAVVRRSSVKKVFSKISISQYSPENTCVGVSFLMKLQA